MKQAWEAAEPGRAAKVEHTTRDHNPMKLPLYSAVKRPCAVRVKVTISIDYQFFALEFGWSL